MLCPAYSVIIIATQNDTQSATRDAAILDKTHIIKRGKWYHYRRRIPGMIAHLDKRKEISIALKTKSYAEALLRAEIYNTHIENFWKALASSGEADSANAKYRAAVSIAKTHGFSYKTTELIAASSLNELVERFKVNFKTREHTEAILGTVEQPKLLLSDALPIYWDCTIDRLGQKNEHQKRKWKNPRRLAWENLIAVVGDKNIGDLTREDILKLRKWWLETIKDKGVKGDTGNKKLRHIKDIIVTVCNQQHIVLEIDSLFASTRFDYIEQSRPSFDAAYVQSTLLPGIKGMKEVYQMVIMAMADTGAREAEIFGLTKGDIYLDAETPYIHIRPREGYRLKTNTSERKIPLVGTALLAFKEYPGGFNTEGNPDTFSTTANKFLKENKLKPTPQHSVYSLRHTFKDRLRDAGVPEELIDQLMGHKKKGPQYGRGHKLETAHQWLTSIAFQVS